VCGSGEAARVRGKRERTAFYNFLKRGDKPKKKKDTNGREAATRPIAGNLT